MSPTVEIRGLTVTFPAPGRRSRRGRLPTAAGLAGAARARTVLQGVDLEIGPAEAVGLVGRSGSGKSLTALALLGMVPGPGSVTAGTLRVAGRDLLALDGPGWRDLRGRRAAMVFQDPATTLNPTLPVGRQLTEPLEAHGVGTDGERRARVLSLLEEVELGGDPAILTRYPHQFSGGQRQRLVLAMALACEPDLLIADEPTTALDVTTQARIVALLARIRARHRTAILWVTHDLAVAAEAADRIAVLSGGRIVEDAPVRRILAGPAHAVTREFLEAARWEAGGLEGGSPGIVDTGGDRSGATGDRSGSAPETRAVNGAPIPHPSRETGPLLAVRDLRFRYRDSRRGWLRRRPLAAVPAVDGVSLQVRAGETLAVVGESGSGKSTLARLVMGLLRPDSGTLAFRGVPLAPGTVGGEESRLVQMVFQDPFASLNPRQRVGDAVREPLDIHRLGPAPKRDARVARLLADVGLDPELARRLPHQLSGGERQRVAIARALATDPLLLVADEPVTALDAPVQRQVMALLDRLRREREMACLLIAHDLATVRQVADRVAVMAEGRIVEVGSAAAVLDHPDHPATRALVQAIPRLPE